MLEDAKNPDAKVEFRQKLAEKTSGEITVFLRGGGKEELHFEFEMNQKPVIINPEYFLFRQVRIAANPQIYNLQDKRGQFILVPTAPIINPTIITLDNAGSRRLTFLPKSDSERKISEPDANSSNVPDAIKNNRFALQSIISATESPNTISKETIHVQVGQNTKDISVDKLVGKILFDLEDDMRYRISTNKNGYTVMSYDPSNGRVINDENLEFLESRIVSLLSRERRKEREKLDNYVGGKFPAMVVFENNDIQIRTSYEGQDKYFSPESFVGRKVALVTNLSDYYTLDTEGTNIVLKKDGKVIHQLNRIPTNSIVIQASEKGSNEVGNL